MRLSDYMQPVHLLRRGLCLTQVLFTAAGAVLEARRLLRGAEVAEQ